MTAATESTSPTGPAPPDPDELRDNLRQADPGVLVAVLAQLTGDPSVIDTLRAQDLAHPRPARAGRGHRSRHCRGAGERHRRRAGRGPGAPTRVPADDRDFFARLLPVALGSEVDDEQVDLLLEQGGFQRSQPTLPRTVPIPDTDEHRHHRCGYRRDQRRAGGRRGGGALRDLRPQRRKSAALGTPPPTRASASTHRRRTTRCRAR